MVVKTKNVIILFTLLAEPPYITPSKFNILKKRTENFVHFFKVSSIFCYTIVVFIKINF